MKSKLYLLVSLAVVALATACGSSNNDNNGATTTSSVESCNNGQVYYNNGCYAATYGNPGNYGYGYTPVNGGVTVPQQAYCQGGWRNGCFENGRNYQWGMYGGTLYYWY